MEEYQLPRCDLQALREVELPRRRLLDAADMPRWLASGAHDRLMRFICAVNYAIIHCDNNDESVARETGGTAGRLLGLLGAVDAMLAEFPPVVDQPQRFGNKGFRALHRAIEERSPRLIAELLLQSPPQDGVQTLQAGAGHLAAYLARSFGNATRIDYGSGHEMFFVGFLAALLMCGAIAEAELGALVPAVFARYLAVVDRIIAGYSLEPAGSHGVWGLDDHFHVAYIWGAAQMVRRPQFVPAAIASPPAPAASDGEGLFAGRLRFIAEQKTGPFHEHSPMLYNISGVPTWEKVNRGLIKMYENEVMAKFPIVQHWLFDDLLFPF